MFESITRRFTDIFRGLAGRKITEGNIKETLREIRVALLEADVSIGVVKDFLQNVETKALGGKVLEGVDPGQQFIYLVYEELAGLMGPVDTRIAFKERGPTVILMAGLQGSGKTTTCGKLALRLRKHFKRKPLLVAADIQRPAAIEQLQTLGAQIGIPVYTEAGQKPPVICKNAVTKASDMGCDTVILDTAGRLHIDEEMMDEIREIARLTHPDEIFLVCDAMVGQDAVKSAREFNEALELTGVILTKLDGDARGGAALSVKSVTGKPIKFVGVGEKLEGTLEEFRPDGMAQRILGFGDVIGLVRQAQEHVDQDEARKMQEKLLENTFTLEDFLQQFGAIKKMGPIKDILAKMPGFGGQLADMDLDDKQFGRIEAIIQSMTPKERQRPEILNTSRRNRISRGAGVEKTEVDDLLKEFGAMKKVMDDIGRVGGKGPFGKLKAFGEAKKKLGDLKGMVETMHEVSRKLDPNQQGPKKGTASNARVDRDEIKRRRKLERQNRRKNRKKH
jgi:signal recognition particle subunit SRP54